MNFSTFSPLLDFFGKAQTLHLIKGGILILVGLFLARIVSNAIGKVASKYLEPQQQMLLRRAFYYLILGIFVLSALREFGFSLEVLLGAAGIFSVAIGFASQTLASNLISGLFLIGERPFVIGDQIKAGDAMGEVLSIDLLSVKLRTADNLYVRVSNELILKTNITNYSKFPIRRFDFTIGISSKEDVEKVKRILFDVAAKNPNCLNEPKPTFVFQNLGSSSIEIKFCTWSLREKFGEHQNSLLEDIKTAFEAEGIKTP